MKKLFLAFLFLNLSINASFSQQIVSSVSLLDNKVSLSKEKVKLRKWEDDISLDINSNYSDIELLEIDEDGKKKYKQKSKDIETVAYKLNTGSKTYLEEGGIEYEIVLYTKPNTNIFTIPLTLNNVTLYYQGFLENTESDGSTWEIIQGDKMVRPVEINSSYAVYADGKKNNEYKTGKICHILRPKAVDSNGDEQWGTFNDDANETGYLVITIPQKFLDNAKYPVIIDPTFGYTSVGASNWIVAANSIWGSEAVLSETADLNTIYVYCRIDSSDNLSMGIYDEDGSGHADTLVDSGEDTGNGTRWWSDSLSATSVAADNYWIVALSQNYNVYRYVDSTSSHDNVAHDNYGTYPLPASSPGFNNYWSDAWTYSMYVDYTASGGGPTGRTRRFF